MTERTVPPTSKIEAETDEFQQAARAQVVPEMSDDTRDDVVGDVIRVDAD
jgi:hypothetical protein